MTRFYSVIAFDSTYERGRQMTRGDLCYTHYEGINAATAEDACFMFLVKQLGYPFPQEHSLRVLRVESI